MCEPKQPLGSGPLTEEQILSAADPGVAMAAYKHDENRTLLLILATMCLDEHCREMFESVWATGYTGISAYSTYGSDYSPDQAWMDLLRQQVEFESDVLRSQMEEENDAGSV